MDGHKKRTLEKKNAILNSTKHLVKTKPLNHITIQDIATHAHVSQVTIYNLFESKNHLVREAIKDISLENVQDIEKVLNRDTEFCDRIRAYFETSFLNTVHTPQISAMIDYVFSGYDPELKQYVGGLYANTYEALNRLYQDGIKQGKIRSEIDVTHFFKMLEMYTQIHPRFFTEPHDMDLLIRSIIKSFA